VKQEWIGNVDFVYSNSWDHSFDPERLFKNWMERLKRSGRLFISWTPTHAAPVDSADCFSASLEELKSSKVRGYRSRAFFEAVAHSGKIRILKCRLALGMETQRSVVCFAGGVVRIFESSGQVADDLAVLLLGKRAAGLGGEVPF
jgi:hypothetical protein